MQGLEKILEEINQEKLKHWDPSERLESDKLIGWCFERCADIIRKHMADDPDGWVPVEKEYPPFGQRLQATILHHEWVTDYDSDWVPEEEKIHHPAYTEVCEIYPSGATWCYACAEDDYYSDVAYIEPAKTLSMPVAEIIAWRPPPEPYRPERSDHNGE